MGKCESSIPLCCYAAVIHVIHVGRVLTLMDGQRTMHAGNNYTTHAATFINH